MGRGRFLIWRLVLLIPTVIGLTMLTFIISRVVPADPAKLAAGPRATPEMVETIRQKYGLGDSLPRQYLDYIGGLLRGDFGESILTQHKVSSDLADRFPATLELVLTAMFLAVIIGVPLGVISAVYQNRWPDQIARFFAVSFVSIPVFWFGIVLQLELASRLGIVPLGRRYPTRDTPPDGPTGLFLIDSIWSRDWPAFVTSAHHLILPALVLSVAPMAIIMRTLRGDVLEVMGQDFVRTARAKGLAGRNVVRDHGLRNSLIPIVTLIGGHVTALFFGSLILEQIFSINGLGQFFLVSSITADFPVIQFLVLYTALLVMLMNLAVDLSYALIDPRVKYT